MEGPLDGLTMALMTIRAIHFAATAIVAGALLARTAVIEPAFATVAARELHDQLVRRILRVVRFSLALVVLTGIGWLALTAATIEDLSFTEALSSEVLLTVLDATRFGSVMELRLVLAIVLALCLVFDDRRVASAVALLAALGLLGGLAWTGHAGATLGPRGDTHLASDVLHLVAACAWVGGLVPFTMTLAACRREGSEAAAAVVADMTERFSTLGIAAVGLLIATGLINSWILVGSIDNLLPSRYGRVLLVKLTLFVLMLVLAACNRQILRPRLAAAKGGMENETERAALRALTRNSVIEIALGLAVFGAVGVLGLMHPAAHMMG